MISTYGMIYGMIGFLIFFEVTCLLIAIFLIIKKSESYSFKKHIKNIFTLTNLTLADYILLTLFCINVVLLKFILFLFVYPLMLIIFIKSKKSLRAYAEQQLKILYKEELRVSADQQINIQYKDDFEIDSFISNIKSTSVLLNLIHCHQYDGLNIVNVWFLDPTNVILMGYDLYIIACGLSWLSLWFYIL